ncbi:MAG TPA: cysteine desulfurase family protein [Blastocatellia bacterium]|jgi:cysteine desulfurase|nr:cysteine desulfurase family protein [Blastocatellia bacterium]
MSVKRIYLDNSASTRVDDEVARAMTPYFTEVYGNASSTHQYGQQAKQAIEEARGQVALLLNADKTEITFLSGGTESDNLAIKGVAEAYKEKGHHIITSQIEHPAVLAACGRLEKDGWRVTYLPVYREGVVRVEDVREALTGETVLVTVMHANNEIGTIQPLKEIVALIKERRDAGQKNLYLHTDAVQSVGKIPVDVKELGVDLLTLTAHKIYGPKGVGVLYIRRGLRVASQMHGGHHERDRRAGTESVPLIVGMGMAAELARLNLAERMKHAAELRDYLEEELFKRIPNISRNGDPERRVPNIANLNFEHVEGEGLQISLDLKGVAVSTGSACASGSTEPSHVLMAIGLPRDSGYGSLRFSFGKYNTREDVDYTLEILQSVVEKLRRLSPAASKKQTAAFTICEQSS